MYKMKKTQKGITLIALIITIIVLLILAVVTINAIQGEGGSIISKANSTADIYKKEKAREKLQLALNEYKLSKALNPDEADLETFLNTKFDEVTPDGDNFKVTIDGYEFTVNAEGNIEGDGVKVEENESTGSSVESRIV